MCVGKEKDQSVEKGSEYFFFFSHVAKGVEITILLAPMHQIRELHAVLSLVIMSEETRHPDHDGVSGKARQLCLWVFVLFFCFLPEQINNTKNVRQ